jgi:iron complex transport system substrate-binding protein
MDQTGMKGRLIRDMAGRELVIPDTVQSVVALRSGALRLLSYLKVTEKVNYIEANEQRRNVPYLFANPGLRQLEIIGAGNNYDTELLAVSDADLVVVTYINAAEADKLQAAIAKPVFVLEYGDMKKKQELLFESLYKLGEIFHRKHRADSLVQYFRQSLDEFKNRTAHSEVVTAYVGGVAYRGPHGLASTEPAYPSFGFLSVCNAAKTLGEVVSSPLSNQNNAFIDIEQLLIWNPDFIFLDAAGENIWQREIDQTVLKESLSAIQSGNIYSVLPYNWYTTNYENILCNTWFIGKTIFPEAFRDVEVEAKCREIYHFMLGKDVFDEMKDLHKPYRKLAAERKER